MCIISNTLTTKDNRHDVNSDINYAPESLVGKQIIAVVNFPPKRIAGIASEVLVLGAYSAEKDVVLLQPTLPVENGSRIG